MTTNFDNSGAIFTLGNCDVSIATTTCNKDMVTDAEFNALWEGNKRRFYVHQAWPLLVTSENEDDQMVVINAQTKQTQKLN